VTAGRIAALALAIGVLTAGCSSHETGPDLDPYVPQGGIDASNGSVQLTDVWIDAPQGVKTGNSAGLRMTVVNEMLAPDALTGVTSPAASGAKLQLDGKAVARIPLGPQQGKNLEWANGSGVQLVGFRRAVQTGQWVGVTLSFANSPSVTMRVAAGPLAATTTPSPTPSPRPSSSTVPTPSGASPSTG
jgi:copper(I)-binding protein